ncbi:hypothetical protein [Falsigemmobacter faecalis]|uniref:Glycosyl transferase n=1 Tax=Falsigemmobacter faecalis TaxID=2488730 RepID=A0A3P3D7U3_9RHOB|nr:hypothetical protein [Falsigemmobacter faecalis]RRH69864.1 hypothetical protein EG244_17840 [Falsigemmobacter faecalis]
MSQPPARPWQLVLIVWGDKYGGADLSRIILAARALSPSLARVEVITDRARDGLPQDVLQRPFPEGWLLPPLLRSGCQAKLAMFTEGLIPADMPALFSDLDTLFLKDPAALVDLLATPKTVALFRSTPLPFGWPGRLAYKLTKGRRYARGNSSLVAFHPAETGYIAARFQALLKDYPECNFHPMRADERFISWSAQDVIREIPKSLAVKMPTEFMLPWTWASRAYAALPFVRKRRAGLTAVTLPGDAVKPEELVKAPEGALIVDHKGRRMIWSDAALGPIRQRILTAIRALPPAPPR